MYYDRTVPCMVERSKDMQTWITHRSIVQTAEDAAENESFSRMSPRRCVEMSWNPVEPRCRSSPHCRLPTWGALDSEIDGTADLSQAVS